MRLDQQLEGILFFKGEPMSLADLARALAITESDTEAGIETLRRRLEESGLTLIHKEDKIMLGTRAELTDTLSQFQKDELNKELSKATLETLSIILYKGGAARGDIDYVRGVNSSFILRNLQMRGLVEKQPDPEDSRRYIYTPTFETLQYLGISSLDELPDKSEVERLLQGAITEETASQIENADQ